MANRHELGYRNFKKQIRQHGLSNAGRGRLETAELRSGAAERPVDMKEWHVRSVFISKVTYFLTRSWSVSQLLENRSL